VIDDMSERETALTRILCVDDHHVVRTGIASMLDREPDMKVVASAASGEEAICLFRQHRPDVTIMDLQLPGMSGLEAISVIRRVDPEARIIVLTMHQGDEDIHRALQAGATTYILKDALFEELLDIVRSVRAGESPLPPNIARVLAQRAGPSLTPREVAVLELIAGGFRNREIAHALGITEETTKVHVKNLLAKLGANDRTEALSLALRRGIVHLK
jgi:DNA-binding NarL/FixJ family response regulator